MKILVIYTHPHSKSLANALLQRVLKGLEAGGHEVDLLDLYAEGFEPLMDEAEWLQYQEDPRIISRGVMREYVERLEAVEGLVFVHPTWFFDVPTMLKGWFDRVWLPGVSFNMPTEENPTLSSRMRKIRLLAVVTTCGSPWWVMLASGFPGKKLIRRSIRLGFAIWLNSIWMCLYSVDTVSDAKRKRFLDKVERRFAKIR